MDIKTAIEKDDLKEFLNLFDVENWKNKITFITNYASKIEQEKILNGKKGISIPTDTQDEVDCLKYAVDQNANKILNHLLSLKGLSVMPYSASTSSYGWPILSMALHNNNYDAANLIINYPDFDGAARFHLNSLSYIANRKNPDKHMDFILNLLDKISAYDFYYDTTLTYNLMNVFAYSQKAQEQLLSKIEEKLTEIKSGLNLKSPMDYYRKDDKSFFGFCDFFFNSHEYHPILQSQFTLPDIEKYLDNVLNSNEELLSLFHNPNALEIFKILSKCPDKFNTFMNRQSVTMSYLNTEALEYLINSGVDLWSERVDKSSKKDGRQLSPLDFLVFSNYDIEQGLPIAQYLIENYTDEIIKRQSELLNRGEAFPHIDAILRAVLEKRNLNQNIQELNENRKSTNSKKL